MKQLISDITFSTSIENCELEKRFRINNGIKRTDGTESGDIPYAQNCYKPKSDWRTISISELEVLTEDNILPNFNRVVSFHRLPSFIKDAFSSLNLGDCHTRPEVVDKFASQPQQISSIEYELDKYLSCFTNDSFEYNYLSATPIGRETSSAFFDSKNEMKLIGLHFDRSEPFDLKEPILKNKNRVGINLSNESRIVYFVNLSVHKIHHLLVNEFQIESNNLDMTNLIHVYYKYLSNYPLISLKLEPYEMYIAPTDNLIHDSTTLNRNSIDILLSYLGYFQFESNC